MHARAVLSSLEVFDNDVPEEIGWSGCAFAHRFIFGFIFALRWKHFESASDALEACLAAQHFQGFKQWRRFLAPAYSYADRLVHLPVLDLQFGGSRAERVFEESCVNSAPARISRN